MNFTDTFLKREPIPTNIEIIAKLHEQFRRKNTTTQPLKSQNPLARASQILFQQRDELTPKISIQQRLYHAKRGRTKKKMRAAKFG